jgi:hypothetical protein
LSEANFITLGRIPEEQKIEIIQTGFRLNQEGEEILSSEIFDLRRIYTI